jgi:hypothetical protein
MPYLVHLARPDSRPFRFALGASAVAIFFGIIADIVPRAAEHPMNAVGWAGVWTALATLIVQGFKMLRDGYRERQAREDLAKIEAQRIETLNKNISDLKSSAAELRRQTATLEKRYEEVRRQTEHQERLLEEAKEKRHRLADQTTAVLAGQQEQILDQKDVVLSLQEEVRKLRALLAAHETPPSITIVNNPQGGE